MNHSPAPRRVDDPSELVELFSRDRADHIYALADLEEPYWSASSWWRRGDAAVGVVGFPEGERIVYAVSTADPAGTLALTTDLLDEIPDTLITGVTGVAARLEAAGRAVGWRRGYHRFHLVDRGSVPPPAPGVEPLDGRHVDDALTLYASAPGAAFFVPSMMEHDTFVGIRDETGALIAIAGTHVVSETHGVAAVGAVFVHPDHRARGLGEAVTAGVLHRLGDRVGTVGLNCTDSNEPARRLYRRMGFRASLAYEECELVGAVAES